MALLGARVGGDGARARVACARALAAAALVVMALAFPIGAWAASGMETGLATALATVAVTRLGDGRGRWRRWPGSSAAFRPEMVVWAMALAVGAAIVGRERGESASEGERGRGRRRASRRRSRRRRSCVCAAVRLVVFGRPAPLAVLAKPSDLAHGAIYVGAATLVVLTPLLVLAPLALCEGEGRGAVARVSSWSRSSRMRSRSSPPAATGCRTRG